VFVGMSVTLVHNERPCARDTGMVPSNTVLDRGTSPPMGRVYLEVGTLFRT